MKLPWKKRVVVPRTPAQLEQEWSVWEARAAEVIGVLSGSVREPSGAERRHKHSVIKEQGAVLVSWLVVRFPGWLRSETVPRQELAHIARVVTALANDDDNTEDIAIVLDPLSQLLRQVAQTADAAVASAGRADEQAVTDYFGLSALPSGGIQQQRFWRQAASLLRDPEVDFSHFARRVELASELGMERLCREAAPEDQDDVDWLNCQLEEWGYAASLLSAVARYESSWSMLTQALRAARPVRLAPAA